MTLEADLLLDRRRLKRRLAFWRAAAVLLVAAGAAFLLARGTDLGLPGGGYVARLPVRGFIGEDRRVIEALDRMGRDTRVRALVVAIDSPGGSVGGGEALYAALGRLRARGTPVVAVMAGTAASAGYMVALPAERVFAREATVTGSIGVILQTFEGSELLGRLGVRPEVIASGPLKDQPSPFRPLSPEGRAALTAVVTDLYEQFVARVAAGRHMDAAAVRALADGRVFTGRQALAAGLVDAIGGEAEARAWLAEALGVTADLPVRDVETRGTVERLFGAAAEAVTKSLVSEWLGVDGFRALWHP